MNSIPGIEARWYAPLLQPVLSTVARALDRIGADHDPWSLPRTGLGGAMVLQVARGFGSRRQRGPEQLAVAAVEGYNHRLQLGNPTTEVRARWLARDLRWAHRAWQSMVERDEPTMLRVVDRLFGPHHELWDRAIPEAVLFMRGAVAAGVVLGEVPESIHAALDEHVTWLGLAWEDHAGTLDEAGWHGALGAIRIREQFPDHPESVARLRAGAALAGLPDSAAVALFHGALAQRPDEPTSLRARGVDAGSHGWMPMAAPALPAGIRPVGDEPDTALDRYGRRWRPAIESAITEFTASGSETLTGATTYLRGQGGKRVRPLVTLAAAQACGGDPQRALPLAAAVEWLHQGSLVLDDIIDAAAVRRGHPALHTATNQMFAGGVAAFVFGRVLRASRGMHPDIRRHVVNTAIALVEGERLELLHTGDAGLPLTRYYAIIEAKTARLFGSAAAIGALCAEATRARAAAASRFGREVGLAFQIVDDLLDYEADEATFGKRPGTDLRAGKATLPLILLREQLDPTGAARLGQALGHDEELGWIQAELRSRGIAERCRERAAEHSGRAVVALDGLPASDARDTLAAVALELGDRRC